MKRVLALTSLVVTASLALSACGGSDDGGGAAETPDEYVVGWINPLSGASAFFGEASRNAIELALADINSGDGIGGAKLKVLYEDNELQPEPSITAFQRLMSEDPVAVLTAGSSVVLALSPLASQNEIMLGNIGAQSPELITDEHPNVYNFIPTSAAEAELLAELIYDREGIEKVATLFVDNDYGIDTGEAFKAAYEELGGEVVQEERHPLGATDMRTQVLQIRGSDAEGLVVMSNVAEVGHAVSQAKEVGIDMPVFGFTYALSPDNFKIAGDAMNGMKGVAVSFRGEEGPGAEFAKAYEEKYGMEPTVFAAVAYDAIRIIAEGLEEVGNDRQALMEYVASVEGFDGVLGETTMTEERQSEFPLSEWEISNGEVGAWQ